MDKIFKILNGEKYVEIEGFLIPYDIYKKAQLTLKIINAEQRKIS